MLNAKTLTGIGGVMMIALLIIALKPGNADINTQESTVEAGESFAVVELFTSEGCSSCPPADDLLGEIVKDARDGNERIFALSFHVDYWNDLGWKDIYSKSEYSQRQRRYAQALGSGVYTPQMIVNGKDQFVGSNDNRAQNSIENRLNNTAAASVALKNVVISSSNQLQVDYTVGGAYSGNVLNVAVVERNIKRQIKRGENRGRTLRHENVVRSFQSVKLNEENGTASLNIPESVDMDNASVIAYVQNPNSKEIFGALGMDLRAGLSEVR